MKKRSEAPLQSELETDVLLCLNQCGPQSLSAVRSWIDRHANLSPDDRVLRRYPSGKEMRLFEQTVDNLLQKNRSGNLTDRGLTARLARDCYGITADGAEELQKALANAEQAKEIMIDMGLDFSD